ncbi:putative ribonuclease H-like domain-containing protein, partial [Tanacetum coccineum]
MELENPQNNVLAKLPMLKLGEYEMWEIRIKQYFQIQDYALWEIKLWRRRMCFKNALVVRLAILGVDTPPEDLNVKFLRSLPSEWDTHVRIQCNKEVMTTRNWNQVKLSKAVRLKMLLKRPMCAIDGAGFDWSDMAEDEIKQTWLSLAFSDYESTNDKSFKEEKEGFEFKLAKFEKSSKDLDDLLASQVTDKSKKGFGYNVVPSPHPLILNRPTPLDLSYTGLEEFKQPEVNEYGPRDSSLKPTTVCDRESDNSKENTDDSLTQQPKTVTTSSDYDGVSRMMRKKCEPIPVKAEKKFAVELTATACFNAYKHMIPRAVLMRTGLKTVKNAKPLSTARSVNTVRPASTARFVNTVRPYNTAYPKPTVSCARPNTHFQNQAQRPNVNTVRARGFNAVKPSACWSNYQLNEKGFVDSGCSRHMSGNIAHLSDFKEFDGGFVTFGGGANGGRITGKGTIKTDKLDFEDVYFVKELKFNLFSVSQMCDKKNYVLFTDSECLVLSPNFKLPDESQVLLKIPRQNNMYSFDMKNIVPKDGLTCLVAKATSEESMLWHRRLGHVNFKNINKLVKDNLVRDLPLKRFENDQTCVACLKGKQHRASCKTKAFSPSTKPLFMLHMDLFGPTFVSSLMHKKYCLVVTDDFSRFSWVFFLRTKDETSEILKNFIKEIENLVDKKVKIIRSDNGTEFKNHVMDEFCREKGIKREYSVARTPQQNGVAERKNRTLIEAARTMLADSKLPTTFWAEAVSTACYVQNRVLVVKPHNKTPYELFRGIKPAIGFMKPFGCHVTILNTLDKLGKFDGKSDEGFFVGYSLSSKAFRVYNIRTRKVQENLHVGFLENKPMLEGNGPKWLFDLDSLTQTMNYVPVVAGTFSNVSAGMQEGSESNISSQQDQDCIFMPIWKDASYFEDITPQSVDDVQLQDQDGNHDDCSFQDDGIDDHQVNTASPQVNTASPQVNTGSRGLSTADSEVNTATSEGLMGPIPTTEDSQEEDQGIDLGNLSPSYAVSSTPHTRIHKDHPIDHVIEEPKRVSKALSDPAWVEAMQEELLQFKLQNVWVLVDLPKGHRAIGFHKYDNEELTINPTQVFSVHNWILKPNQPKEPPFTNHMKAICNLDVYVDSKTPKYSSPTEEFPQGKKLGARSGLRRKQSLKHTSKSTTKTSKSQSGHSKKETKSSSAMDTSTSHPSTPTPVVGEMHKE